MRASPIDWIFIASGPIVGVVLVCIPDARLFLFTIFVFLETGHAVAPIALAWMDDKTRRLVMDRERDCVLA
jgi:hypothetical protein